MLLAIDTATRTLSLALHDGVAVVAESSWRTADHHTVELAPQTALLLRRAGLTPDQLPGVAVALGPGSYTGLRIGLGLAKGLALAHNLPLIGVPTFEILMRAQPAREESARAVLQAGRGRILVAPYRWNGQMQTWESEGDVRVTNWARLAEEIAEPTFICGEVDATGRDLFGLRKVKSLVSLASPAQSLRRAGYLAEIGWERLRASPSAADHPDRLAPIYAGQPEGSAA
jgi:tRNA threonylcarbamoyladenosine biosynthesis protein TsaB